MIADGRPVTIKVIGGGGSAPSREAESLGLIATELIMNGPFNSEVQRRETWR
jgi:chemotaxis protein methyltransferase CheR